MMSAHVLVCWPCCQNVIRAIGIPSGSSAYGTVLGVYGATCWWCECAVKSQDDADLMQWLTMASIFKYEIALARTST